MAVFPQKPQTLKSLKNMEPMSGFEPLTYALRRRWKTRTEMIDFVVIADMGISCQAFTLSNQFPFVSFNPTRPDP